MKATICGELLGMHTERQVVHVGVGSYYGARRVWTPLALLWEGT